MGVVFVCVFARAAYACCGVCMCVVRVSCVWCVRVYHVHIVCVCVHRHLLCMCMFACESTVDIPLPVLEFLPSRHLELGDMN